MEIHLSKDDGIPIYRQVVNQLKYMISAGRLEPGEELPSVRSMARTLVVNPNTIARAYRDLEIMGLVVSRQGHGTFVTDAGSPLARREKTRILTERVDALLAEARQLGFSSDELHSLMEKRIASMDDHKRTA